MSASAWGSEMGWQLGSDIEEEEDEEEEREREESCEYWAKKVRRTDLRILYVILTLVGDRLGDFDGAAEGLCGLKKRIERHVSELMLIGAKQPSCIIVLRRHTHLGGRNRWRHRWGFHLC